MTLYEARIQRYNGRCRPSESIMQLRSAMTSSTSQWQRSAVRMLGACTRVYEVTEIKKIDRLENKYHGG